MRAKTIQNNKSAVIFDFDDTLVKTDAKTYIYNGNRFIRSLSPEEFNNFKLSPGERLDLSDFVDPRFIINAKKYKMWPMLQKIDFDRKQGKSDTDIFILTAREPICQGPIHSYLLKNGIRIPEDHIITVGRGVEQNIPEEKRKILRNLKNIYSDILFIDDSEKNIKLASEIGGIKTILAD